MPNLLDVKDAQVGMTTHSVALTNAGDVYTWGKVPLRAHSAQVLRD